MISNPFFLGSSRLVMDSSFFASLAACKVRIQLQTRPVCFMIWSPAHKWLMFVDVIPLKRPWDQAPQIFTDVWSLGLAWDGLLLKAKQIWLDSNGTMEGKDLRWSPRYTPSQPEILLLPGRFSKMVLLKHGNNCALLKLFVYRWVHNLHHFSMCQDLSALVFCCSKPSDSWALD